MKKNKTLFELIIGIIIFLLVVGIIGAVFREGNLYFYLGLLLGGITAVILAIHMYVTLDKSLDMEPDRASKYAVLMYLVRAIISIISMIISIKIKEISIVGCLIGIMSLKAGAYLQPITNKFFRLN